MDVDSYVLGALFLERGVGWDDAHLISRGGEVRRNLLIDRVHMLRFVFFAL